MFAVVLYRLDENYQFDVCEQESEIFLEKRFGVLVFVALHSSVRKKSSI